MADRPTDIVMLSERISVADLASEHFRAQLLERVSWAVGDADATDKSDADATEQDHRDERSPALPCDSKCAQAPCEERARCYVTRSPARPSSTRSTCSRCLASCARRARRWPARMRISPSWPECLSA